MVPPTTTTIVGISHSYLHLHAWVMGRQLGMSDKDCMYVRTPSCVPILKMNG